MGKHSGHDFHFWVMEWQSLQKMGHLPGQSQQEQFVTPHPVRLLFSWDDHLSGGETLEPSGPLIPESSRKDPLIICNSVFCQCCSTEIKTDSLTPLRDLKHIYHTELITAGGNCVPDVCSLLGDAKIASRKEDICHMFRVVFPTHILW